MNNNFLLGLTLCDNDDFSVFFSLLSSSCEPFLLGRLRNRLCGGSLGLLLLFLVRLFAYTRGEEVVDFCALDLLIREVEFFLEWQPRYFENTMWKHQNGVFELSNRFRRPLLHNLMWCDDLVTDALFQTEPRPRFVLEIS